MGPDIEKVVELIQNNMETLKACLWNHQYKLEGLEPSRFLPAGALRLTHVDKAASQQCNEVASWMKLPHTNEVNHINKTASH